MTAYSSRAMIISSVNVSDLTRLRDIMLTAVVWLGYLYFMRAFFGFMADVTRWILTGFIHTASYHSFSIVPTFISYALVVIICGMIFIGWALYNQLRFRGRNRRKSSSPVAINELAEMHHVSPDMLKQWQQAKVLIMQHDREGKLVTIKAA